MCAVQQYCLRWNNHRSNLLTVFDELLQNEAFTDVTLACEGGNRIKCHRMVLAACSPYFQNIFTDLPCKHPVVVLKDVKFSEIKAILEYMYRGEVNVAQSQLAALLKVAEALKVKGLVEETKGGGGGYSFNRDEEAMEQQSPTDTNNSNCSVQNVHSSSNNSPPHSTSYQYKDSYNSMYGAKQSNIERNSRLNLPIWQLPIGSNLPLSPHSNTVPEHNHPNSAIMLNNSYKITSDVSPLRRKKLSSILMNRDTPILRTVLGQGQVDSSQHSGLVCPPDSHEQQSNGPEYEKMHMKNEPSEDAQSPYTDFASPNDDEEKSKAALPSSYPQACSNNMRAESSGIATYVPAQRPEWKRYKQYTREHILAAIEDVKNGMSALQAARKYKVPSRTLYDKVKKLGITTSRPFKRGSNGSPACFPYGLSGTGSPYGGQISENEDPATNNNTKFLEASFFQHALENRGGDNKDTFTALAIAAAAHGAVLRHPTSSPNHEHPLSPSPSPTLMKYPGQDSMTPISAHSSEHHHSEINGSSERDRNELEDQVEDLSISRKQESRVIISPINQVSTIIKKEDALKEIISDTCRMEISAEKQE